MQINRSLPLLALIALVSSCAAPPPPAPLPPPAPAPAPAPAPTPAPTPAPAPPARPDPNWRDAPMTPGDWSYREIPGGSLASFGEPGAAPLLRLRCDKLRATMWIERTGTAPGPEPMSLVTTSMVRPLSAMPAAGPPPVLRASLAAGDPALDAMAFSRGRFAVEIAGLPTLIVPPWAEIGRVIEDCR